MKTIELNLYKFNELSNEAKQKAIELNYYFNVDHEWWNCTYDDAENIGLEITGFDLGRSQEIGTKLVKDFSGIIDTIISEHGETCETFKTAMRYRTERSQLVTQFSDGITTNKVAEEREDEFDEIADDQEKLFRLELGRLYLEMLRKEYDWLTGDKAIEESLVVNEYDFLETGVIY